MKTAHNAPSLPDCRRPFQNDDFRGFLTWGSDLTARIGGRFYHACHEDEAKTTLDEGFLGLRSMYYITHPFYGRCDAPCVWCGLNYFHKGNLFGPVLLSFPLKRLAGR
jgi:hypothetical protein